MSKILEKPEYRAAVKRAKYFDIHKNWRKLGPIFKSEEARRIWKPCMEQFDMWRFKDNKRQGEWKSDPRDTLPRHYDSCDWRFDRARELPFWDYACHSACHWVVDLALFVAMRAYPDVPWRIVTSKRHTTVWNGSLKDPVMFDINFCAIGVKSSEAMEAAFSGSIRRPGVYLKESIHLKP